MIIKKYVSGTGWVAESPKVTFTDIVDNVGATTPVSIFNSGKLREDYLPNSVYGGMKFVGSFSAGTPSGPLALSTFITGTTTTGYTITSTLDALTGLTWSAGYDGIGQRYIGHYWVCVNGVQVDDKTSTAQADWQTSPAALDDGIAPVDAGGGIVVQGITLEAGDWLIITGYNNTTKTFVFSVINNTYAVATSTTFGVVKLGYTTNAKNYQVQTTNDGLYVNVPWTDTVYTLPAATSTVRGGIELFSDTQQTVAANAVSATANRTYGVQVNADGQAVVNVPWVDTDTTYSVATSTALGLVEIFSDTVQSVAANAVSTTASRTYGVQLNSNNQLVVNVPWVDTDTTYGLATTGANGLVRLGVAAAAATVQTATTTAGRFYHVGATASGNMYVNVPWTDTTYTAGNGISLSSTTFSVAAGIGLTQEASGLAMTQPHIAGTATPASGYQIANTIWFDLN